MPFMGATGRPVQISGSLATSQLPGALVSTTVPNNWNMTANTPNMWILRAGPVNQVGFLAVLHPVRGPAPGMCSAVPGAQVVPPTAYSAFIDAYMSNPCLTREGTPQTTTIGGRPATRWRVKVVNAPKDNRYCPPAGCVLIAYEQLSATDYDYYYLNQGFEEMLWAVDLGDGREPFIVIVEEGIAGTLDQLLPIVQPAIDALRITLT
jgi:hypothetical protein